MAEGPLVKNCNALDFGDCLLNAKHICLALIGFIHMHTCTVQNHKNMPKQNLITVYLQYSADSLD